MHAWLMGVVVVVAAMHAALADDITDPPVGDIAGGTSVLINDFYQGDIVTYTPVVYFGDVPAPFAAFYLILPDPIGAYEVACIAPPHPEGVVDIRVEYVPPPGGNGPAYIPFVYPAAFTYIHGPILQGVSPTEHSILTDDRQVTLTGQAFSVGTPVEVWFGDRSATNITVDESGESITCTPPPYVAGTPFPQSVDMRVVNTDGNEAVLPAAYTYTRIAPVVLGGITHATAWMTGQTGGITLAYIVDGPVQVYFEDIPAYTGIEDFGGGQRVLTVVIPAHAPGYVSVTIVNGDGGTSTTPNAFLYDGTPGTIFHTADRNEDYRLSVSELMRVIQFYNAGAYHCDPSSEDGYEGGPGDTSCTPHDSDYAPQNWKINMSELLQLIEFYNENCYQACATDPSGFCPPDAS